MTAVPSAEVRAWARANGYTVSDRGRLPLEVQAAYDAAHAQPQVPLPADPPQPWPAQQPPVPAQPPLPAYQQPWPAQPGPQQWGPQQWGPQQWGPPQGQPHWPPPIDHGREGFAVAALVLGILPICAGVLGIVFGIIALNRIAGTAKKGRNMAIAGIVCGSLWVVGGIAAGVLGAGQPDRGALGTVTSSGDVGTSDLRVGDCAETAPQGTMFTVHLVPCSTPHGAEVFALFNLGGSSYPGRAEVDRFAAGGCRSRVHANVRAGASGYELYYLVPTSGTWITGDRQVACFLGGPDGTTVTGSVRNA